MNDDDDEALRERIKAKMSSVFSRDPSRFEEVFVEGVEHIVLRGFPCLVRSIRVTKRYIGLHAPETLTEHLRDKQRRRWRRTKW